MYVHVIFIVLALHSNCEACNCAYAYTYICAHVFTSSVSEDVIPDFEVGRDESVGTTILCSPRIPISEPWLCTAICGPSPMLNSLTVSASGFAEPNANAIIRLPLLNDRMYYCVVNATTDDDTVTELRGRLMFNLSGMYTNAWHYHKVSLW